jgi:sugar phosphate isomerase/epimerase
MKITHARSNRKEIVMPIHAYAANEGTREELSLKTVELFHNWTSMIKKEDIPFQFGLELNRRKPASVDPGDSCEGVIQIVKEINSPKVGITWDIGHHYSNILSSAGHEVPPEHHLEHLPPLVFLENTVHTHIHGLGIKGTHCPLTEQKSLPLELYVEALKNSGYRGIYNLELTFSKFPDDKTIADDIFSSIERLRNCVTSPEAAV